MNILIPNATGKTNSGDQAILTGLLQLLKDNFKKSHIVIQSTYPELSDTKTKSSLFQFVVIDKKDIITRIYRISIYFFWLFSCYLHLDKYSENLMSKEFKDILNDYKNSDLVVFVGGGYLTTKHGVTQSLNFLMLLSMIKIAVHLKRSTLLAPISFGPFANDWQAKFGGQIIKNTDYVCAREKISLKALRKNGVQKAIMINDTALYLKTRKIKGKKKDTKIIGFTIRNWYSNTNDQTRLEQSYVRALSNVSRKYNFRIQPILQVYSPDFPKASDHPAMNRVISELKKKKLIVNKPIKITSVKQSQKVYGEIDFLLGMRLHSIILAAIQNTPFLAISYEHKTDGILGGLGLEKTYVKVDKTTPKLLSIELEKNFKNRSAMKTKLAKIIPEIQKNEKKNWQQVLSSYK